MSEEDTSVETDVDTDPVDEGDATSDEGADKLTDAGKQALDRMKQKWQKERDARKALEDQIAAGSKPKEGEQPDPEKIREQARAEARAETLRERAMDKVEAKAAKLFADPEDAVALLRSKVEDFIDDGSVDADAIEEALSDLLKKKPHLAAQGGRRFSGSADGGARNGKTGPAQLTREDVQRLMRDGKHAEVDKARLEGRLDDLLSGKK